jgi:hypothetical protein
VWNALFWEMYNRVKRERKTPGSRNDESRLTPLGPDGANTRVARSHGQVVLDWLSLFDGDVVVVQEVYVQGRLQGARQNLRPAKYVFHLVSVNPSQKLA